MTNPLDVHVAAYEGKTIYDFDNEILLTWYPKRIARAVNDPRAVLDLGLGHGFATEIFSGGPGRHVVLEGSPAVIENFKLRFPDNRSEVMNRRLGNLAGMLPDMQALSENDLVLGHQRYFTINSLTKLVNDAGYKI